MVHGEKLPHLHGLLAPTLEHGSVTLVFFAQHLSHMPVGRPVELLLLAAVVGRVVAQLVGPEHHEGLGLGTVELKHVGKDAELRR